MASSSLNRAAVEERVRQKCGWMTSNTQAHQAVAATLESIGEIMKENVKEDGFKLRLPLFGSFAVKHVPGRLVRNPKTGEKQMAPARRKIRWAASPNWKEMEVTEK